MKFVTVKNASNIVEFTSKTSWRYNTINTEIRQKSNPFMFQRQMNSLSLFALNSFKERTYLSI